MKRRSFKNSPLLFSLVCLATCSWLDAVELTILLHHRGLDLRLPARMCYRSLAIAHRACDKGSGGFGHAWLWIHGLDERGKYWDVEVGHTGEGDLSQKTILEQMIQEADVCYDPLGESEPLEVLFRDRWDGALEMGSGGHLPDCAFSFTIDQAVLDRLWAWIESDGYGFERYNLMNHQCCHFIAQALLQVGVSIELKPLWRVPQRLLIGDRSLILYRGASSREIALLTPKYLGQCLYEQLPGLTDSLESYKKHKLKASYLPWRRFWQRRAYLKNFFTKAPGQLQRLFWLQHWKEG